jgi:acetyl-CoA C-acetyltransferase
MIDPRTPVLVGVGTCLDDLEPVELMRRAADAAADDAGARSLLPAIDRIAVPRGTWSYTDPARLVAEHAGATRARTVLVDLGIPQQTLINQAMRSIIGGDLDVALVVGAEAKARAARAAKRSTAANAAGIVQVMRRASTDTDEIDQGGAEPDEHQTPTGEIISRAEIEAGLFAPVEQYALMESALGAAEDTPDDRHRRDIAELCARFNAVAQTNPEAAFPEPKTVDDLLRLDATNRPLAFPYGKWHASQWTVDQGAALLLCSVEAAERHGVPRDRWIFPLVGVESSLSVPLPRRRAMHRWPAMQALGDAATARLGRPVGSCEHMEIYSCFPVAVRVQQRELGLQLDADPTVTGGMAFGGGPFNSFVLQATAAMVRRLRDRSGTGLVTTVSGMLTKPGLAVWSTDPDDQPPLVADLATEAARRTDTVGLAQDHTGNATVAASTVTYDGLEPAEAIAVLDTPEGDRVVARSQSLDVLAPATRSGLVGVTVAVDAGQIV